MSCSSALSQAFSFNMPVTCRNYWWSVCHCWLSTSVGSLGMHCILVWLISTGLLQIVSKILDLKRPLICFPAPFWWSNLNCSNCHTLRGGPTSQGSKDLPPIPWCQTTQEPSRGPVSMPLWSVKLSHIFLIWSSGEFGGTFSAMSCSLGLSWAGLARWQGVSSCWRALCCEGWFCSSVWVGDASVWT